jgi:hypothetical protein
MNLKANTIAQNVISQLIFTHANFMVEARIKRHDDKEAEILFKADAKRESHLLIQGGAYGNC